MAAAAITAAAVIAACGSDSPNRPSSTGAATTTVTPNGALAYARCMRAHGVPNFPDPTGGNNKRAVISAMEHVSDSRGADGRDSLRARERRQTRHERGCAA